MRRQHRLEGGRQPPDLTGTAGPRRADRPVPRRRPGFRASHPAGLAATRSVRSCAAQLALQRLGTTVVSLGPAALCEHNNPYRHGRGNRRPAHRRPLGASRRRPVIPGAEAESGSRRCNS
jgi:hypothetical protein